ncbi:phosphoglycerate kinase [Desulfovibrio ferrophilus]|uniref:phosphoglycerate kinase n=1 Tax=Desulfovibrio ferrophilus TaxID=241368 RepID=UPI001E421451|nr:phosphoglycerate kinase [Desulfovibrio ferrophilus]
MRFIDQMDLPGKKVLIRVDYNVPLKNGAITDDNRIQGSLPTLEYALEQGAALILCSHLGKPKGKVVPEFSMAPVAQRLSELLGRPVQTAPDCVGPEVEAMVAALMPGDVLLLENLRYHAGEQAGDDDFAKALASLCDVYCCDAFGTAHRAHASMTGIPAHAKEKCGGFLLKKEWEFLGESLKKPARPYVAISGGAKVSSKLAIIQNLLSKVNRIIIGGAMANTFFLAMGHGVGKSLAESDLVEAAKTIMADARRKGVELLLPVDVVLASGPDDAQAAGVAPIDAIGDDQMVLDAGPESVKLWAKALEDARTVVWNGPVGLFENPAFAEGSKGVAEAVAGLDALTIIGGGDTGACLKLAGLSDKVTFISTGGGSFLEFMEGKELPAFKALEV